MDGTWGGDVLAGGWRRVFAKWQTTVLKLKQGALVWNLLLNAHQPAAPAPALAWSVARALLPAPRRQHTADHAAAQQHSSSRRGRQAAEMVDQAN